MVQYMQHGRGHDAHPHMPQRECTSLNTQELTHHERFHGMRFLFPHDDDTVSTATSLDPVSPASVDDVRRRQLRSEVLCDIHFPTNRSLDPTCPPSTAVAPS
eukprot:4124595-Prymnesium_polylepis.1